MLQSVYFHVFKKSRKSDDTLYFKIFGRNVDFSFTSLISSGQTFIYTQIFITVNKATFSNL